jgi:hypothetical protein
MGRGATRDITGSAYFRASPDEVATAAGDAVAALDARFSISSPQRKAQLRARAAEKTPAGGGPQESGASGSPAITGSFAIANDRVTGNAEFLFRSRGSTDPNAAAAHDRLTGEGRAEGVRVSGAAWSEQSNVTGTDGSVSVERNPSERAGKPQAFSGAQQFKKLAKQDDAKQRVTGLLGWSGKTAARVTLSGGAQA